MTLPFAANQNLKTLIVDFSKGFGGASTRVLSLLRYLPANQVGLVGLTGSPVVQAAQSLDVPVYTIGSKKFDIRILTRLVSIIRQDGYQVIDTHNIQAKFWGSLAAAHCGVALVSTIHSWYAHEHGQQSQRGQIYTALELHTNRKLGAYITVSTKDREMLLKAGIAPEIVELIYNAVSIDVAEIPDEREHFLNEFGLASDTIICMALGRIVKVKGYDILIEAISLLADQIPNLACVIVGDGELHAAYRHKIRELKLHERVHLAGYRPHTEALALLKASNIFVMPSRYEGTPIALLEAAALGKAIVASSVGGIPELVTDGEQASLVLPEDPKVLAQALSDLIHNPAKRHFLGKRASERVQMNFGVEKMIENTQRTYIKAWLKNQARNRSS